MLFKMKEVGFTTETQYGVLDVASEYAHGFLPHQLMVASIAVCSGGIMRTILDKKRISYRDIAIETAIEQNKEEANRITKITLHFIIDTDEMTKEKMEKIIHLTTKYCPMVQSVKESIEIVETVEIRNR